MSGVPGIRNPIARGLFTLGLRVENFARWWNHEPLIARGGVVRLREPRGRPSALFPPINNRDREMGFAPRETPILELTDPVPEEPYEDVGRKIGRVVGEAIGNRERRERR